MSDTEPSAGVDLLHGVEAIGAHLGLTKDQAKHWIKVEGLPTFKMGRAVCARRSTLRAWIADREATGRSAS